VTDLHFGQLTLGIEGTRGQEHRIGPIAHRAATLFATRLGESVCASRDALPSQNIDAVSASAPALDLRRFTDEQAAGEIAASWLGAVAARLRL
jgi:hypothetical protein